MFVDKDFRLLVKNVRMLLKVVLLKIRGFVVKY